MNLLLVCLISVSVQVMPTVFSFFFQFLHKSVSHSLLSLNLWCQFIWFSLPSICFQCQISKYKKLHLIISLIQRAVVSLFSRNNLLSMMTMEAPDPLVLNTGMSQTPRTNWKLQLPRRYFHPSLSSVSSWVWPSESYFDTRGGNYLKEMGMFHSSVHRQEPLPTRINCSTGQGELAFSLEELEAPDIASPPGRYVSWDSNSNIQGPFST